MTTIQRTNKMALKCNNLYLFNIIELKNIYTKDCATTEHLQSLFIIGCVKKKTPYQQQLELLN